VSKYLVTTEWRFKTAPSKNHSEVEEFDDWDDAYHYYLKQVKDAELKVDKKYDSRRAIRKGGYREFIIEDHIVAAIIILKKGEQK